MSSSRGGSIRVKEAHNTPATVETVRALSEAREVLSSYEASALAGVAETLSEVAESLARTSRELKEISPDEWMDADQAAAYLKKSPKTFRNIVAAEDVPRHYLTERGVLFSRKELDEWLMSR
jgi:hypothetical protein